MKKLQITWNKFQDYKDIYVSNFVPERAGVYVLFEKCATGWKIFYVGQADNLKTRLLEHLSDSEKNLCIKETVKNVKCGFTFATVGEKSNWDGIEKYLYERLKPRCNQIAPPDFEPIEVNVPEF